MHLYFRSETLIMILAVLHFHADCAKSIELINGLYDIYI